MTLQVTPNDQLGQVSSSLAAARESFGNQTITGDGKGFQGHVTGNIETVFKTENVVNNNVYGVERASHFFISHSMMIMLMRGCISTPKVDMVTSKLVVVTEEPRTQLLLG